MIRKLTGFLLLLTACRGTAPLPPATALPTPQPLRVALTPALLPLRQAIGACQEINPELALVIESYSARLIGNQESDLWIQLGGLADQADIAIPLGWEAIRVVVHPQNPLTDISAEELQQIYSGALARWESLQSEHLGQIQVWAYPTGNELRQMFDQTIIGPQTRPYSNLNLAPNPRAMVEAIGKDPNAVGYVPNAWLDESLAPLRLPPDVSAVLRFPILASGPQVMTGPARVMLNCLQTGAGQRIIRELFEPWELN